MISKLIKSTKNRIRRTKDGRKLPHTTLPYQSEVKRVQKKWFLSFLIMSLFALWYSYQFSLYKKNEEKVETVWVAKNEVIAPAEVSLGDFVQKEIPAKYLPHSAWDPEEPLEGKTIISNVRVNQIITVDHLQSDINPESISTSFSENFAFSLDESWLSSKLPDIEKNDQLDIVVTSPKSEEEETTKVIVSQATVLEVIVSKNNKKTLVLNVSKEDAQMILFSHGLKLPMQVLIRPSLKSQQ